MSLLKQHRHPADQHLLLLDEDELSPRSRRMVERHLLACSECRARRQQFQVQNQQLQGAVGESPLPAPEEARLRLQNSLESCAEHTRQHTRWLSWKAGLLQPALLLRAGMIAALLVLAVTCRQAGRPLQNLMDAYEETGPEPDRTLTPGSASALTLAEVCQRTDDDLDPKLSQEQQRAVFRAYRLDERAAKAYQVDYLINPQLGGDSSPANLWPEPYHATIWNATAKDALETRLHGLVCSGQLDLQSAQQELATDWIAAYKKYFHASRPVRTLASAERAPFR